MSSSNDIDYEPGDVSAQELSLSERRDMRRWRFMQLISFLTLATIVWVGIQSYKQNRDKKYTDGLISAAQQRACDLRKIRNSNPAQTAYERAAKKYYDRADTKLDCRNTK